MIKQIDIQNLKMAKEVLEVQIPSYQIEADMIGYPNLPPLNDTVGTIQHCGETFIGFYEDEELCGAISFKIEHSILDIHRLIVHPNQLRKGIAMKLLNEVQNLHAAKKIIVSTGSKNTPAVQFYLKNGFQIVEEVIVNEQLSLKHFEKNLI